MDLSYVLSWLVGSSCALGLLLQGVRLRFRNRGWAGVFLLLLALLGAGSWLWPAWAGQVAAALWLLLVVVPLWGVGLLGRLLATNRDQAARRLARLLALLHPADGWRPLPQLVEVLSLLHAGRLDEARELVAQLRDVRLLAFVEARVIEQQQARAAGPRRPWMTMALMAVNLGFFAAELPGGTTDPVNLVRLGALVVPPQLVPQGWLRIFSAGFLHFGAVHLLLNLLGLWLLGRQLERERGRWALLASYALATFGGNALALVAMQALDRGPAMAVGASGGVMGILGTSLALVAVELRRRRTAALRQQLQLFGMMLGLQLIFDLFTPRVSSTIHLSGLVLGAALGGLLAWKGAKPVVRSA